MRKAIFLKFLEGILAKEKLSIFKNPPTGFCGIITTH